MPYFLADPQSKLSWSHDWSEWLESGSAGSPTDTIVSREWRIERPSGGSPQPTLIGALTDTVFVEGLEAGIIYWLTEHIVTAAGVEDERTVVIRCDQV
jgi:hypothetical protein